MLVTLLGITILVRLVQSENAKSAMLINLLFSSKIALVRLSQFENAFSPMLVTPLGITIPVRLVQPENAKSAMLINLLFSSKITLVRL